MLKMIEPVVKVMTLLKRRRSQLLFTIVQIHKQPFSPVFLKHNCALKLHPSAKVHRFIGYCFVCTKELFSGIRFKIRLLTFTKFEEFVNSSTVKAGFNVFFYLPA